MPTRSSSESQNYEKKPCQNSILGFRHPTWDHKWAELWKSPETGSDPMTIVGICVLPWWWWWWWRRWWWCWWSLYSDNHSQHSLQRSNGKWVATKRFSQRQIEKEKIRYVHSRGNPRLDYVTFAAQVFSDRDIPEETRIEKYLNQRQRHNTRQRQRGTRMKT